MNRRSFLISSGAGALVVGCSLGPTGGKVWRDYRHTGQFAPNAWIRILADNTIVFILDRTEMGQGTTTSHAVLVCEELEVDPTKIHVENAEAAREYDNRDKQINIQITGGSTSTSSSWEPLREAGAVAREMLRRGAASLWNVPLSECQATGGTIVHAKSKRTATYGSLIRVAAAQDVPHVKLKDPEDWKLIGKSLDRLDSRPKVDGTGIYGIDVRLPGMLTAVIVRPPVRKATVKRYDDRATRARRGVHDVVVIPEGVAVIAEGYWEARTAADLLAIEWNEGHGATIDSDALFASFDKLASRKGTKTVTDRGNAPHAADPKQTIEATYKLPYLAHATMEPQNATAWIQGGRCEVWAPTQAPGIAQWRVAEAIGFDIPDVAIHTTMVGGGFGRRGLVDYCVEAARLAQATGKPIQVIWSREDDQTTDWYRPMALTKLRGVVDRGAIKSWRHRLVSQSILAEEGPDFVGAIVPNRTPRAIRRLFANAPTRMFARGAIPDPSSIEGAVNIPYGIPNLEVEYTPVETGIPVGFWRSVGSSHTAFVVESFFDELAHLAGKDPYELRRSLLDKHPRHKAALELAATKAGWGQPLPAGVGRGIAIHESFKTFCAMVIEASVDGNRVVLRRVVAAIDCGMVVNPNLVAAQVESAVIFGLSAALKQKITLRKGRVQETNFNTYKALRMYECPPIETHLVESKEPPSGVGEPGLPPVAPALCNAIFAATGKRIRTLPIEDALQEKA